MRMRVVLGVAVALVAQTGGASAQGRGTALAGQVAGEWRGMLKPPQGAETPFVISIVEKGDQFAGVTSGLTESTDVPLKRVVVDGTKVSIEAVAESKLGQVVLAGDLLLAGNKLSGPATLAVGLQKFDVTIDLTRRARAAVPQRQVERTIDYFVGRWTFVYTGGDFPPLSSGGRTGTITFTRNGRTNFGSGEVEGELRSKPYRESHSLGVDPETNMVVYVEHRADGTELVSLGSWQSPLAIVFQTSPVVANGRTYQLRRVISVTSDDAFDVTEDFSVDGGAFRRLGKGHCTRVR